MAPIYFPYNEATVHKNYHHGQTNCELFATQSEFHHDTGNYWCDTCDKGFQTALQLERHKRTHQKCNIDGCQFIAHPNIITKHIQMQHATGLYNKIAKLNNPEEIKKWREERKKKYPTKQNIEKKTAQFREKVARGEKIGILDPKQKRKTLNPGYLVTKKQGSFYKNTRRPIENKSCNKNKILDGKAEKSYKITIPKEEESRALKPFGGIQDLMYKREEDDNEEEVKNDDFIEEDEYAAETPEIQYDKLLENSEAKVCGALTSLICNYGSSDDESSYNEQKQSMCNNEQIVEVKSLNTANNVQCFGSIQPYIPNITKPTETLNRTNSQILSFDVNKTDEMDDDSGPEETKIVKKENDEHQNSVNDKISNLASKNKMKLTVNMKNKTTFKNKNYRRKLPSTLLEKLLHKEIQKERNIVLQCIRYIVQNNYFKSSRN